MVKKYEGKIEIGRIKVKIRVVKIVVMDMGKMREKEGLKMKNKGRYRVKVKKVSKIGRNLMDFDEKLKVLSELVTEGLEKEGSV